jgi:hypothetical protein
LTRRGKPHLPPAITTADLRKNIMPVTSGSNASTVINKPDKSSHCGERYTVGVGWEKIPDEELPKEPSERHMSISEDSKASANHAKDAAVGRLDLFRVMLNSLIDDERFAEAPDFIELMEELQFAGNRLRNYICNCNAIPTQQQRKTIRRYLKPVNLMVIEVSNSVMALESDDLRLDNLNSYLEACRIYVDQKKGDTVNMADIATNLRKFSDKTKFVDCESGGKRMSFGPFPGGGLSHDDPFHDEH